MSTQPSFKPLAARLAAKAAEIRPADGAEVSWANFMALFWWSIFQMLIALCEALDARAALVASSVAVPVSRADKPRPVTAGRVAVRVAVRAPAWSPDVQVPAPERDEASAGTAVAARTGPWLAWSRPPGPRRPVAVPKSGNFRRTSGFRPGFQHAYFITIS